MHKPLLFLSFLSALSAQLSGQIVSGRLHFDQGKTLTITVELKSTIAQQAGGQAIDFSTNGTAVHSFTVTNVTDDNTTLHHRLQRIAFEFDGMGQKISFDPDKKNRQQDLFGKQFDEILAKKYDVVIDPAGTTLMAIPEKVELTKQDERLVIITNMLKDLTSVIYPPKKGTASFFRILPGYEAGIGDSWTDTVDTEQERSVTVNTLSAITDSTIVVDFKTSSVISIQSEMMGMQAKTNLSNTGTGKIILDRATGIIREKTSVTDSNGSTEVMGSVLPLTGKTTITMRVKQD